MPTLHYGLYSKHPLSLNLYEAETYSNAVIVQPLIGNLVRYSNMGRYEPFLAESWEMETPNQWNFKLRKNLVCENGEVIDPATFKRSIELSLRKLSQGSPPAVLSKLEGYSAFIKKASNEISGIRAEDSYIRFSFESEIDDGVVQILSFAPFGYICSGNRDGETGEWNDESKFISSGPYRLSNFLADVKYDFELREGFGSIGAPANVEIHVTKTETGTIQLPEPAIFDNALTSTAELEGATKISLVPEYLNYVSLSPVGALKDKALRSQFAAKFNAIKATSIGRYPKGYTIAQSFYPSQPAHETEGTDFATAQKPTQSIRILGKEPKAGVRAIATWSLIRETLEALGWKYHFEGEGLTYFESNDPSNYDIRMGSASIGGGVEPWAIDVLYCSDFGPRLPDPDGEVCDLLPKLRNGGITLEDLPSQFELANSRGKSVLPVAHYGITMFVSPGIDRESVSPLISVLRFDELRME